jgi:glutamate synthase (NADPH/NADH) small chain
MDCSVPFCHQGCPLGNLVPDWNDLVYRDRWRPAFDRLAATNNFPEFTGRLCPAPCEGACVLGINSDPVTIKSIELAIVERAFDEGWIQPRPPARRTGQRVAVIGSGPAGLTAADELNRAGHTVVVFERDDRIGGLLRYGIPDFKMEKRFLERRLAILEEEGIVFRAGIEVGVDVATRTLQQEFDAVVLAGGAPVARDLDVPGRSLDGIHFAMTYLTQQNRRGLGEVIAPDRSISAAGKRVVIIGGGDTGADCLGTVHRQGQPCPPARAPPRPPETRAPENPWPQWLHVFRVSSAHEEGGERPYSSPPSASTRRARPRARVARRHRPQKTAAPAAGVERLDGTEAVIPADLVLIAMGFTGPERGGLVGELGVRLTERGTVWRDDRWMTSVPGVFTAGDMQRGQSLIVWAIATGRSAARGVDLFLTGSSDLAAPVD